MTTLKTEILRPEAAMLLEALIASPELASFTLMGGTALALQIGHRTSLDFDFAKFDEKLDSRNIDAWHERMKLSEIPIQSMVSPNQISQFRINSGFMDISQGALQEECCLRLSEIYQWILILCKSTVVLLAQQQLSFFLNRIMRVNWL
jgi:hypothetical protein